MGARDRSIQVAIALALAAAALLAALATGGPAAAAPVAKQRHTYFGYNENWFAHRGRLDFTARGGADTTRAVISWSRVEPAPGRLRWNRYDRLYAEMLETGTRPLWVLGDAPCWAQAEGRATTCRNPDVAHPPSPAHDRDFAVFAANVAARYPAAVAIETWNEANLWSFWGPEPDPERAAITAAWAYVGVKYVNPQMPVVLGGLSPVFEPVEGEQIPYKAFLRRAYAAVGPGYWDAVAIHPFPSFQKSAHYLREVLAHLRRMRKVLRASGAAGTPIWVTEIGLSTNGLRPYSPDDQAKGLVRIYRGLAAEPDVPAVIVHRLIDQSESEKTAESGWGVVRHSGRPKPAYCALADARGKPCGKR